MPTAALDFSTCDSTTCTRAAVSIVKIESDDPHVAGSYATAEQTLLCLSSLPTMVASISKEGRLLSGI